LPYLNSMIYQSLRFIAEQLNAHLHTLEENTDLPNQFVILNNIDLLTKQEIQSLNNAVISLINISEESSIRNLPNYRLPKETTYSGIPLHLDLYVLISSCVAHSYENSLNHLSQIITFFHNDNTFSNLDDLTANTGSTKFKLNI